MGLYRQFQTALLFANLSPSFKYKCTLTYQNKQGDWNFQNFLISARDPELAGGFL